MKASPRILSSPGAPWRSTGRPVTAMRTRHWPIPKCLCFRIGSQGGARSILPRSGADIELTQGSGTLLYAFEPELAGVCEHGRSVALDVLVEPNARTGLGQDRHERGLANLKRITPQVVAVQFDQVEG